MSIITISRGSYSHGKEVAEIVGRKLGYEVVARDVLLEASQEFNIPEMKLLHALQDSPSILDRFTFGKEKYIAYIQAAILKHLKNDNVVYHGFAGHFFVSGISHVLKVRIIADLEDRIRLVMARDNVDRQAAIKHLKEVDAQRRKWSTNLYGIDTADPSLYDLVIHIKKISVEDAAKIVIDTVGLPCFQKIAASQRAIQDLATAAAVKAALIGIHPNIEVTAQDGMVYVNTTAPESREPELVSRMKDAAMHIEGVRNIQIHVSPITPYVRSS